MDRYPIHAKVRVRKDAIVMLFSSPNKSWDVSSCPNQNRSHLITAGQGGHQTSSRHREGIETMHEEVVLDEAHILCDRASPTPPETADLCHGNTQDSDFVDQDDTWVWFGCGDKQDD